MPLIRKGLSFEMPGKFEIMREVRKGLDSLEVGKSESNPIWTKAVKTKLCEIGRSRFGCRVYARTNEVDEAYRDGGEWLYDVTWLEYEKSGRGARGRPLDGLRRQLQARFQGDRRTACWKGQGVQGLPPRGCLAAGGMGK